MSNNIIWMCYITSIWGFPFDWTAHKRLDPYTQQVQEDWATLIEGVGTLLRPQKWALSQGRKALQRPDPFLLDSCQAEFRARTMQMPSVLDCCGVADASCQQAVGRRQRCKNNSEYSIRQSYSHRVFTMGTALV
ncbi:hypothetical protein WJX77_002526 [Trebouxia sp. C0004]